jgi:general secretion pathway protein L
MVRGMLTQAGVIWARWVDGLAAALFAAREIWRAQRALVVAHENGQYVIRHGAPAANPFTWLTNKLMGGKVAGGQSPLPGSVLAALPEGTSAPDQVVRAARNSIVALEHPRHELVERRISVPLQAREFLPGIVRNRIERLSPWQADQALYGFEIVEEGATALDVRIVVASRAAADDAQAQFAALGLPLDRIVACPDKEGAPSIALWSRLAETTGVRSEEIRRQISATVAAVFILSVGWSIWAFSSAASMRGESEELAARSNTLQRQLQGARATPAAMAALGPAERAWVAKESAPHAVIVIEALSRALPDSAYLTELRLEGKTVRIAGLADDTPSLIAPLEQTGHLSAVRSVAPATRDSNGARFRFNIEAQVVPHLEIPEH